MKVKTKKIHIGIDLMGSENDPESILMAIFDAFLEHSEIELTLIGSSYLEKKLPHNKPSDIHFTVSDTFIEIDDDPLYAIRRKKNSSMAVGISLLKEQKIDAFISAGNTGALVSIATMGLSKLPGVTRPALTSVLPTKKGPLAVLDVGANLGCKAEHLVQYAILGATFQKLRGIDKPNIGLLNIGSEEKKGTSQVKEAFKSLSKQKSPLFTFAGNIEAKEAFDGEIDVLVTDGFTGNVFLKTAEGIASLVLDELASSVPEIKTSLAPFFQNLKKRLHYTEYPGALLLGVKVPVVKCHSYSSLRSIIRAIEETYKMVDTRLVEMLEKSLQNDT